MKRVASHQLAIREMEVALNRLSAHSDFLWTKQSMETLMAFNQAVQSLEYTEEHFDVNPKPTKRTA